jgi:hypothetical protein
MHPGEKAPNGLLIAKPGPSSDLRYDGAQG